MNTADDRLIRSLLAEVFTYRELLAIALERLHAAEQRADALDRRIRLTRDRESVT